MANDESAADHAPVFAEPKCRARHETSHRIPEELSVKILVLNPNSDPEMTEVIRRSAEAFAGGAFEVECVTNATGPRFIDSYREQLQAGPGTLALIEEHEGGCDAIVLACGDDPNLDAAKEATERPVVGIGEASMKLATLLAHRFSVVTTGPEAIPHHERMAREYGVEPFLASVRAPREDAGDWHDGHLYREPSRAAVEEDGAEAIVLSCAGLAPAARRLQEELGVPVLDGVVSALIVASGLVRAGLAQSKRGRYRPRPSPP